VIRRLLDDIAAEARLCVILMEDESKNAERHDTDDVHGENLGVEGGEEGVDHGADPF
jgi:hypothetical protein